MVVPGNTKGGGTTVPLASCLTGLESAVCQLTIFVLICKTDYQTSQTGDQQYSDTSPLVFSAYFVDLCVFTHQSLQCLSSLEVCFNENARLRFNSMVPSQATIL
jgi:hypothetical protein